MRFHWQPVRKRKTMTSIILCASSREHTVVFGESYSLSSHSIRSQRSSGVSQIVGKGLLPICTVAWPRLRSPASRLIFGDRLQTRQVDNQFKELLLKSVILNRITHLGMPDSVKVAG